MNGFCLRIFKEDLDSKLTLSLYKTFFETTRYKCYLDGGSNAALMLKWNTWIHEEFGRQRRRENKECLFCDECESVSHVCESASL